MFHPFIRFVLAGLGALTVPAALMPSARAAELRQDAYVWQRAWNEPVLAAVASTGTNFTELTILAAEVSWKNGQPTLARPTVDYASLRGLSRPVGLALRIGPFAGPFMNDDVRTRGLAELAAMLVNETRSNQVAVAELQLDFDCAESKLEGYRVWVEAIRQRIAPVPLTITTLPAWLKQPAFAKLVAATDGYVLQVHSLERPKDIDAPFVLCDPEKARKAVEQAGRLGVAFRVALPTYGYLVAFDQKGAFIGLSAEGPVKDWPEGVRAREVQADPAAMAALVATWQQNRPASMTGVIWYRLPVTGERRNWRWPTLASVMAGRAPESKLELHTGQRDGGLVEIELRNRGTARHNGPVDVALNWSASRIIACDGLSGFAAGDESAQTLHFKCSNSILEPGQRRIIGWIRFEKETHVEAAFQSAPN